MDELVVGVASVSGAPGGPSISDVALTASDLFCSREVPLHALRYGAFPATSLGDGNDYLQRVIDGLAEQIAIVDTDWTILLVNRSWGATASKYRPLLEPGQSYAAFLAAHAGDGNADAMLVLEALDEIREQKRAEFSHVYSGSGLWAGRDFRISIRRFNSGGRELAIVTRYDITELVQLKRQREELGDALLHVQEDERRRIGRELHDTTAQSLTALHLGIARLRKQRMGRACAAIFDEIDQTLANLHQEIRTIAYLAHPPSVAAMGLRHATDALVHGFARRAGLRIGWKAEGALSSVPAAIEAALYRLLQEALTNVHKHARAANCSVRLILRRRTIHLVVTDDGVGILPSQLADPAALGVGINGMRARIEELSGRFTVRSGRLGTMVRASVPLVARSPAARLPLCA